MHGDVRRKQTHKRHMNPNGNSRIALTMPHAPYFVTTSWSPRAHRAYTANSSARFPYGNRRTNVRCCWYMDPSWASIIAWEGMGPGRGICTLCGGARRFGCGECMFGGGCGGYGERGELAGVLPDGRCISGGDWGGG